MSPQPISASQPINRKPTGIQQQTRRTSVGAEQINNVLNQARIESSNPLKRHRPDTQMTETSQPVHVQPIGSIVAAVLPQLQTYIVTEIKNALKPVLEENMELKTQLDALKKEIGEIRKEMTEKPNDITMQAITPLNTDIEQQIRDLREELIETKKSTIESKAREERQEQYSRRESLRLFNVTEQPNESTDELVVRACQAMGLNISREHISVSHRIGSNKHNRTRPIICKFISRNTKYAVLEKRANLRWNPQWNAVRVYEDLTPQRSKIIRALSQKNERFSTMDGRIEIRKGASKVVIDNLLDLEPKLGWKRDEILNLFNYQHPVNQQPATD